MLALDCLLPHIMWFKRLPLDHVELALESNSKRSKKVNIKLRAGDHEAARFSQNYTVHAKSVSTMDQVNQLHKSGAFNFAPWRATFPAKFSSNIPP